MTGHRALEKKQITQGNSRKVQNPSGSPKRKRVTKVTLFFCYLSLYYDECRGRKGYRQK